MVLVAVDNALQTRHSLALPMPSSSLSNVFAQKATLSQRAGRSIASDHDASRLAGKPGSARPNLAVSYHVIAPT